MMLICKKYRKVGKLLIRVNDGMVVEVVVYLVSNVREIDENLK